MFLLVNFLIISIAFGAINYLGYSLSGMTVFKYTTYFSLFSIAFYLVLIVLMMLGISI